MYGLYQISEDYASFVAAVENGDIPEEAIKDTLEAISGEFNEKADNIACLIKNLNAEAAGIKTERNALDERYKSKLKQADNLKHYLSEAMQNLGFTKIETSRNFLSFRKSTAVVIADEEQFKSKHRNLCKVEEKVTIPKSEIAKLLKDGQQIDGAELQENRNLQVK